MTSVEVHNPSRTVGVSHPGVVHGVVLATGPQGPPGPEGPSGGSFVYVQETPAATWTIHHGTNRKPLVSLILTESPNEPVYTDVKYPDNDTIVVEWPQAESGWAYL